MLSNQLSTSTCFGMLATLCLASTSQAQTLPTTGIVSTPSGVPVGAPEGTMLWDQPPTLMGAGAYVDQEFETGNATFSTYLVHDVVITDDVNVSSVIVWFTDVDMDGAWTGVTEGRLNIFSVDPLTDAEDPGAGMVVPVTSVVRLSRALVVPMFALSGAIAVIAVPVTIPTARA